jgi:hypothetical protein
MPSTGGFQIVAGRIPGERIATTEDTSDTAGFTTTETVLSTVTAPVVAGRQYRVRFVSLIRTTVAGDDITSRIREDNSTGTERALRQDDIIHGGALGVHVNLETALWTASSTGDKTFVATAVRIAGTGTISGRGATAAPRLLYVDYITG